jgi:hypothetical protein
MSFRTIVKVAIIFLGISQTVSAQSGKSTSYPVSRSDAVTWQQYNKRTEQMSDRQSIHANGKSQTERHPRTRAQAKITVQSSEAKPYDQSAGPSLMELRLSETFTGDIDGQSTVRALQVQRDDKSARQVSLQRFIGKLGGRQGTFVLQGSEVVEHGEIKANWFVVPGSGTGELSGLRGEGGFEGQFGKGSQGTLDYWFE